MVYTPPEYVYEDDLFHFIDSLNSLDKYNNVSIEMSPIKRYSISAIVALLTKIICMSENGINITLINAKQSDAYEYLQRINFFRLCGIDMDEDFNRRDPSGRFLPIKTIGNNGNVTPEYVSTETAECLATNNDDSELFNSIEYSVSELVLNVNQHSQGTGYIGAQYYGETDIARIVVSDYGVGILSTFKSQGLHWQVGMDDLDAIEKALESEVSSKRAPTSVDHENAGVGLTLLHALAKRVNGRFIIASGEGYYSLSQGRASFTESAFQGTLCSMAYKREDIDDFDRVFREAQEEAGLIDDAPDTDSSEGLFI